MTRTDPRYEDWKQKAAQADILQEAVARGAKLKRTGKEHIGPCPACGGRDRFSINVQKQIFNCRGSTGGNVISMVMHLDNSSFMQSCEALTGEPPPNGQSKPLSAEQKAERQRRRAENEAMQRHREAEELAYQENTKDAAQTIWNASKPVRGTPAELYLKGRGFIEPEHGWPGVFRFHPGLPHPEGRRHPALVCLVDDVGGGLSAVWRIYLKEDGSKADVENVKLGLGPASGGAVRIGGIGHKIGIAEGVESALGAWMMIGMAYPVWASLSTSGMVGFEPPIQIESVTIFPDGDAPIKTQDGGKVPVKAGPGRKAAQSLKASLDDIGITCTIAAEPPIGTDYCDLWNAMKENA